jgi:hypothetical protein
VGAFIHTDDDTMTAGVFGIWHATFSTSVLLYHDVTPFNIVARILERALLSRVSLSLAT